MLTKGLILCILVIVVEFCSGQNDGPIVNTNYGDVRGFLGKDYLDRPYDGFLGIPYAKPPIDDSRWQKTERQEPWEGVVDATEYSKHCIQPITVVYPLAGIGGNDSEDCLYLDVFVPGSIELALANPLPVMVFIYGGGFVIGTTEMYKCEELATSGQVITVAMNYRVNIMGFLSTGDAAAPGNYGLWDQKAALEWVNENIPYFGGDISRITIFGHSAGATATSLNALSPQSNHLFQRVISLSGSAGVLENSKAKEEAQSVADLFNCSTTDSQEIVDCLKQIDGKELDSSMFVGFILGTNSQISSAVIDGEFVVQDPIDSWNQGAASHLDFMTGYTFHDAFALLTYNVLGLHINRTNDGNLDREQLFEKFLNRYWDLENGDDIIQMLYDRFPLMNDSDPAVATRAATRMETDRAFAADSFLEADKHAKFRGSRSTYHYEFRHRMSFLTYPEWTEGSHLDDIYGVLGDTFMKEFRGSWLDGDFDEDDRKVSSVIVHYLANFAYSGNPNDGPHVVDIVWPAYNNVTREYLLEAPAPSVLFHDQDMLDNYNWFLYEFPGRRAQQWNAQDFGSDEMLDLLLDLIL